MRVTPGQRLQLGSCSGSCSVPFLTLNPDQGRSLVLEATTTHSLRRGCHLFSQAPVLIIDDSVLRGSPVPSTRTDLLPTHDNQDDLMGTLQLALIALVRPGNSISHSQRRLPPLPPISSVVTSVAMCECLDSSYSSLHSSGTSSDRLPPCRLRSSPSGFSQILFVFLVLTHERRRVPHFNLTANPTARWAAQQIVEASPWLDPPKYLLRDRDKIYGESFRT